MNVTTELSLSSGPRKELANIAQGLPDRAILIPILEPRPA